MEDQPGHPWEWDDFISVPLDNPELDRIRARCDELPAQYPSDDGHSYCNDDGLAEIRSLYENLSESLKASPP